MTLLRDGNYFISFYSTTKRVINVVVFLHAYDTVEFNLRSNSNQNLFF